MHERVTARMRCWMAVLEYSGFDLSITAHSILFCSMKSERKPGKKYLRDKKSPSRVRWLGSVHNIAILPGRCRLDRASLAQWRKLALLLLIDCFHYRMNFIKTTSAVVHIIFFNESSEDCTSGKFAFIDWSIGKHGTKFSVVFIIR